MFLSDADQRTIAPTPRRLEEARSRGQVPRSNPFTSAVVVLVAALVLWNLVPQLWAAAGNLIRTSLAGPVVEPAKAGRIEVAESMRGALQDLSLGAAGVLTGVALAAVAANILQFGFRVTPAALSPDPARIHPGLGLRRVISGGGARFVQNGLRVVLAGLVAWSCAHSVWPDLALLPATSPEKLPGVFGAAATGLMVRASIIFLLLSLIDLVHRRWRHQRDLRMTPDEAREEARQSEPGGRFRRRRSLTAVSAPGGEIRNES